MRESADAACDGDFVKVFTDINNTNNYKTKCKKAFVCNHVDHLLLMSSGNSP